MSLLNGVSVSDTRIIYKHLYDTRSTCIGEASNLKNIC